MIAPVPHAPRPESFERLGAMSRSLSQAYLSAAREVLRDAVDNPGFLDAVALERRPGAYTRSLVFGDGEISVWALVWAPGSATSIHDHHCSCCFGVVKGIVTEIWFRAIDAGRVTIASENARAPGFVAAMLPSGANIHQMRNDGIEEAVTVHIYGFDHRLRENSIEREYALARD